MERWIKPGCGVIGLEGSTEDGEGFVARLWEAANSRFSEVAELAARSTEGALLGVWGAMTDPARRFLPWEKGFTRGLYLAGVECRPDAVAPEGWTRWDVPGFEYIRVPNEGPSTFPDTLEALKREGLSLAGAVQDYTDPADGRGYMCFPVRRLD